MSKVLTEPSTKPFSKRVADFTILNRKLLTVLSAIISLLLAMGIVRTSFDTSLEALLTESDPYLDELFLMNEAFPSPLEVRFAFVADGSDTVFNRELLTAIDDLKDSYSAIPFASGLTTILDYVSPETQRRLFIKTLRSYSEEELGEVADAALADRLLTANLLSDDAALTFAIITTDSQGISADDRLDIATAALQLRDEIRSRHPDIQILANSEVMLEQSSQQAMVDDLTNLMPFVILACVLAICYCFRSATLGICILTHVLFTLLCTIGALGLSLIHI